MNLLCTLFGHKKMTPGWYGDIEYGTVRQTAIDGTGRVHGVVMHECERCQRKYVVSRLHLNAPVFSQALSQEETK